MKKKKGQFDHYKVYHTHEGYTFLAETFEDAVDYIRHVGHSLVTPGDYKAGGSK